MSRCLNLVKFGMFASKAVNTRVLFSGRHVGSRIVAAAFSYGGTSIYNINLSFNTYQLIKSMKHVLDNDMVMHLYCNVLL